MPPYMTGAQDRNSWRFRFAVPADVSQRGDLTATVALVAFLAQLIFAQLTLATTICLVIIGKVSRWRRLWLAVPAAVGVGWLLAAGVRPAMAGYLAGGSRLIGLLARHDTLGAKAKDLSDMLAGWRRWLPGQMPVALIVATAQAAIRSLPGRMAAEPRYRGGALVAARSSYLAATLRRGEVATCDGCCLGIVADTGRRASVSWQEAEAGVLCAGLNADAVSATGRDLALAAIQHRKTVVIIDLAAEADTGAARRADFIESECAAVGAPLRRLGGPSGRPPESPRGAGPGGRPPDSPRLSAHYDPLSRATPALATSLLMAMIDWTGVAHARRLFCANYLNSALVLLAARRADQARSERLGGSMLSELVELMSPGALRASLVTTRGRPVAASSLATRVAELSMQLESDPATLAPMAVQLAELSAAALAQLIRPAGNEVPISVAAALAGREVALFSLDRAVLGRPATMIARLAVADLIESLGERSDLGSRTDCLVWINGCQEIDRRQLSALIALGERTGTAVVLGTALGSAAARIAADVNVVAVRGASPAGLSMPPTAQPGPESGAAGPPAPGHDEMADVLARFHEPGCPDWLSFAVRRPSRRLVACCRARR